MRTQKAWPSLLLALVLAVPALAAPQDKPKGEMKMDPMTEAYMKAATPGAPHERLAKMVGHWTTTMKMWMAPDKPAMESTGTMDAQMALGGRYLVTVHKSQMMGMPFEGHEIDGYDNASGQYVGTWVDNMGTGIMSLTGSLDASGKVMTMTGDFMDPLTHKKMGYKGVSTHVDDNTLQYESYMVEGGKDTKVMEMTAKREK
jgi:hypothetical protein